MINLIRDYESGANVSVGSETEMQQKNSYALFYNRQVILLISLF